MLLGKAFSLPGHHTLEVPPPPKCLSWYWVDGTKGHEKLVRVDGVLIGTFLEYKSGALPLHTFVCWGPQIFHLHRKNRELKVREELFSTTLECHLPTCMYGKFGEMFHLTVRICALVGYYAECCGNNLSVPSSRSLKMGPDRLARNVDKELPFYAAYIATEAWNLHFYVVWWLFKCFIFNKLYCNC